MPSRIFKLPDAGIQTKKSYFFRDCKLSIKTAALQTKSMIIVAGSPDLPIEYMMYKPDRTITILDNNVSLFFDTIYCLLQIYFSIRL
ncbi:hypothetical protein BV914_10385 [Neisseria dumasiana]|nr:hypothetical protein BV914_10385 [Neisseria dumasiana]